MCDAANVLNGFQIEAAMLGVDERPVKARGCEKTREFGRSQLAEIHAELEFSGFQGLFDGVRKHLIKDRRWQDHQRYRASLSHYDELVVGAFDAHGGIELVDQTRAELCDERND